MLNENNTAVLIGKVVKIEISHVYRENIYYQLWIESARLSGKVDTIPVIVKEYDGQASIGDRVYVEGSYRSRNINHKVSLYLYADCIREAFEMPDDNYIELRGYICKNNGYRKTPRGKEITDAIIALQRPTGRKDYIPCIFWGINAGFACVTEKGDNITARGRIQSREYKKLIEGNYITKTAFEVSVKDFNTVLVKL